MVDVYLTLVNISVWNIRDGRWTTKNRSSSKRLIYPCTDTALLTYDMAHICTAYICALWEKHSGNQQKSTALEQSPWLLSCEKSNTELKTSIIHHQAKQTIRAKVTTCYTEHPPQLYGFSQIFPAARNKIQWVSSHNIWKWLSLGMDGILFH